MEDIWLIWKFDLLEKKYFIWKIIFLLRNSKYLMTWIFEETEMNVTKVKKSKRTNMNNNKKNLH